MTWKINWSNQARKQLRKLDGSLQRKVVSYLTFAVLQAETPRQLGKPLYYGWKGMWRYRVNDIRIICQINEDNLLILVLRVGHRKAVYRNPPPA